MIKEPGESRPGEIERFILRKGLGEDEFKLGREIRSRCGGKEKAKKLLKVMEEKGWIEVVGYGKFKVTEKGVRRLGNTNISLEDYL